jgi:NitT/TauT family transport system ATP-binding protein
VEAVGMSLSVTDETPELIAVRDVGFAYEAESPVLTNLSFTVRQGTVTAVVGPSGCGKTTLLYLLAGILRPSEGDVHFASPPEDAARHPLTMLFQRDTLLPWLNVEKNVGLHFRLSGSPLPRPERKQRVEELIRLAGLGGSEHRYPYQLSGGMRRRVAFLASVAPLPRVLLLDEPFSALDEPTRVLLHQDVHHIIKNYGIAVVIVTHDLAEAISLSDEVVILSARPARDVARYMIAFGAQRDMLTLRKEKTFLDLYGELWEALQEQIASAAARTPNPPRPQPGRRPLMGGSDELAK